MGLEIAVKLPSEAEQALGNTLANGNAPSRRLWFWVHRRLALVYRLRASRELDYRYNILGTH